MGRRALFVFTPNQYNVVFEMMKRVAVYLERELGYEIMCCGVGEDYQKARLQSWDFIFSVQGIEFEFLPGADGKRHFTWICDHPYCILPRFVDYADKEHMYVGCVDRTHSTYLKHFYGIENAVYMPHFGWRADKIVPYEKRSTDVFFPASYTRWEQEVKTRYPGLVGPLKVITERTISYMLEHDDVTLEGGFEAILRDLGEEDTDDLVRECMEFVAGYADSYWRQYYRKKVLLALLDAGITVTVCGRNWNYFKEEYAVGEKLIILSEEMPYEETIERMADSKMVLNVMPGFKDGCHERIAMATLNGAVCLTDTSRYIEEIFGENKGVVIYDRKNPKELAEQINALLQNPNEAKQIARRGQMAAEEKLMVEHFVKRMLEALEG